MRSLGIAEWEKEVENKHAEGIHDDDEEPTAEDGDIVDGVEIAGSQP